MMKALISLCIVLFVLTGCNHSKIIDNDRSASEVSTHNPTAKDILIQNPNADIFLYEEIIYQNASAIEWIQLLELTIGESVGTIKNEYKDDLIFNEEMATKLPIGTEIYKPLEKKGAILIVELNGREIRYYGLIEG